MEGRHVVALSGGKDSTALALRLSEVEPRDYTYLCVSEGERTPLSWKHAERARCNDGPPCPDCLWVWATRMALREAGFD